MSPVAAPGRPRAAKAKATAAAPPQNVRPPSATRVGERPVEGTRLRRPPGPQGLPGNLSQSVQSVLSAPGTRLDPAAGAFFEARLGHRFAAIRIHTDRTAGESARAVGADAYTVGRHVVFAPGRYAPRTPAGGRLLAHELAHAAQQDGARPVPPEELEIGSPDTVAERAAERASLAAVSDGSPVLTQPKIARQLLQRAEAGTYVSRGGPQTFLNAAFNYYRGWGHPNVRRVDNLEQVVANLASGQGTLDTFRIVSHANPGHLLLGFSSAVSPTTLDQSSLALRDQAAFRDRVSQMRLLSNQEISRVLTALRADAKTGPLLGPLGVGSAAPANDSPLGILLRAIIEKLWVDTVQLTDGSGAPAIPDRAVVNAFNSQRIRDFGEAVVTDFTTDAEQKAARKALKDLQAQIGPALTRASHAFPTLTQDEANALAGPFTSQNAAGASQLDPEISQSIAEGSGQGAFLRNLDQVRARTTAATHVEIRGCEIGRNPAWLDDFRAFMGTPGSEPSVSAPDLFQYYFPLNFQSFTQHPQDEAALDAAIADPDRGLERDFRLQTQVRRGDLIQVSIAESGTAFIQRYGLAARNIDLAALRRLNPEITSWSPLPRGKTVFLKARQVPAGTAKGWEDIADRHFGDRRKWPKVWSFNPQINRTDLQPNDQIFLQSEADRQAFGLVPAAPTAADVKAAIRGGQAVVSIEETAGGDTQPRIHLDHAQRRAAIAAWLETQRFDPQGRTAAELSRLFAADFGTTARRLHMLFLSRGFPKVADPIFPDDPRFDAHIIRRP